MAQTYNVTLYYNTGFDRGNVPARPSVLTVFTSSQFPAVFRWQNRDAGSIRIKATWDQVKDADYLQLGSGTDASYYVISSIAMLNDLTAELIILLDPLNTAGGVDNITIVGGWAKRAHTADDKLFGNIIDEPWGPSQQIVIRASETLHEQTRPNFEIVLATCDVSKGRKYSAAIATVSDESGNTGQVVWPELPAIPTGFGNGTVVKLSKDPTDITGDNPRYTLPHLYAFAIWTAQRDLTDDIEAVHSIGVGGIVNSYCLPYDDVEPSFFSDPYGAGEMVNHIEELRGLTKQYTAGSGYEYGSVRNKKALSLYNYYTLVSVSSGSSETYEAHDIATGMFGDNAPKFYTRADPSPTGTVYMSPFAYKGKACQYLEHAVPGAPWLSSGLTYQSGEGSALTLMNMQREIGMDRMRYYAEAGRRDLDTAKKYSDRNIRDARWLYDSGQAALSSLGSGTIGLGGITDWAQGVIQRGNDDAYIDAKANINRAEFEMGYTRSMGDKIFRGEAAARNIAPQVAFPASVSMASYVGNVFLLYHFTLSDSDLARFDRFLTMYGYACDKRLEKSDLTNRTKFNYILTTEAQIKSPYASQSVCQQIADMFDNGVRIWHTAPTSGAYDDNPIRS